MHKGHFAHGTVEGTGATINISCGFTPEYVRVINVDGDAAFDWTDDLADGEAYKSLTGGTNALMATLGITPYAGTVGGVGLGFSIGADTDVNVSAQTMIWVAFSGDS